jgi:hypothetical protein
VVCPEKIAMPHAPHRRRVPALLVAASLVLLPAMAQARPSATPREDRPALSLPQQAIALFGNVWHVLTSLWGDSGVSIDPDGAPAPAPPNGSGASIDTNGLPGDSGPSIDPDGFAAGDPGGSIDPNG